MDPSVDPWMDAEKTNNIKLLDPMDPLSYIREREIERRGECVAGEVRER